MLNYTDGVPPDGSAISVIVLFHIAVLICMYTVAVGGIIFCIVCLVFNIVFRKRRSIYKLLWMCMISAS